MYKTQIGRDSEVLNVSQSFIILVYLRGESKHVEGDVLDTVELLVVIHHANQFQREGWIA